MHKPSRAHVLLPYVTRKLHFHTPDTIISLKFISRQVTERIVWDVQAGDRLFTGSSLKKMSNSLVYFFKRTIIYIRLTKFN